MAPNTPPQGASASNSGDKVIAYAGYIDNKQTRGDLRAKKVPVLSTIGSFFGTTIPGYIGRQHPMLRYLNREIAMVPVQDSKKDNYAFNDGIVPISSSLSFSSSGPTETQTGNQDMFEQIKTKVGVKKARLFPNIDHVTFMYGTGPSKDNADLPDKLSPEEKPRPIFSWLLIDILNSSNEQVSSGIADSAH